jgi:hypothetical protein
VEVWRASREEEAVQRAAAAEASRAVASWFVDLGGLPTPSSVPRAVSSRGRRAVVARCKDGYVTNRWAVGPRLSLAWGQGI